MLCGVNENLSILEHAYELWKGGKGVEFVDSSRDDTNSPCKLMRCLEIALLCVQENPNDRPSMLEVSSMLKNETTNINTPKKPAFSKQVDEIGIELLSTTQLEKCSAYDVSLSESRRSAHENSIDSSFDESLPARAQTLIKVGYWDSGDGFPISDVNFALFTHLMCGFADVNSTTYELSLSPSDEEQFSNFTDTVKIKNPSITTLLSIGGGNNPNYSTYSSMSASSSSRKSFIDSSIKIARLYGFQGLDLSWNSANTSRDKYNIGILFKEWRAAVDLEARNNSSQSQLILTAKVAHSPLSTAAAYPVDSIRQYLNWVHVMTTGYSKPTWKNFTGAHAALYDPNSVSNTEYGITEWIEEGLSADKLVLCLPFYGFAWTLVKPEDNGIGAAATGPALYDDGLVTYKEIKNHIKNYGPNVRVMYNSTYVVNYCSIGKIWFGFDDVEAVRVKVSYAKEKKLRGYYVWEVSYDHYWMLSRAAGIRVVEGWERHGVNGSVIR
ncbi:hypothetical protein WN943_026125 [Citrus x changshan-huyou]